MPVGIMPAPFPAGALYATCSQEGITFDGCLLGARTIPEVTMPRTFQAVQVRAHRRIDSFPCCRASGTLLRSALAMHGQEGGMGY